MIFTTNYDCVLDDVLQTDEIKHLHGGFFYKKQDRQKRSDTLLGPDDACLIWGISGEEKEEEMKLGGGFTFPIQFPLESPMTIFRFTYLNSKMQMLDALIFLDIAGKTISILTERLPKIHPSGKSTITVRLQKFQILLKNLKLHHDFQLRHPRN